MEPARQDPEGRPQRIGRNRTGIARHAEHEGNTRSDAAPRRVDAAPALVMVAAPVVGLLIWGGLIALAL